MSEFRTCISCGYSRGFHVSFAGSEGGPEVVLICPECGASYSLGLREDRIASLRPVRGADYPER